MDVARAIMLGKGVPRQYWGDAVMTASYLINRLPTINLKGKSPYEVLNKKKPRLEHLKVFGCKCYVFLPEGQRNKLEARSLRCVFIGYSATQKGYKCYHPETRRVYVSRDVKFVEGEGYFNDKNSDDVEDVKFLGFDRIPILEPVEEVVKIREEMTSSHEEIPSSADSGSGGEENMDHDTTEQSGSDEKEEEQSEPETTYDNLESSDTEEMVQEMTSPSPPPLLRRSSRLVSPPALVLRKSLRQKFPPENWKKTRVYFNNVAAVQPDQNHLGCGSESSVINECIGRTASFKCSPIGDNTHLSRGGDTHIPAYPIEAFCSLASLPIEHQVFLSKINEEHVPNSYEEACQNENWIQAMDEELKSMDRNNTWEMVELPKGKKSVGCRWVYTIKYTSSGDIERYKARLVAKGYTQVYGEDYTETFAPVAKLHSVRILLSIAVNLEWELWQMDVKNAFLQGELEEEVYMKPPQGCDDTNLVCKLRKAIYGLKQSPRAWYQKLSSCLLKSKFRRSEADHTLFTRHGKGGIVVVLIYVDDLIITGSDVEGVSYTKTMLKTAFDIKDLGELKYFLGIEMTRFTDGLFISQRKYVLDLLSETGKLASRPAKTPIEEGYQDHGQGEPWEDVKQYQRLVGKLIYLTITRPDICFAVNQASQHMQKPTNNHWNMVERILRYLKKNPGKGVWLKNSGKTDIVGFCDADWAGNKEDRKSTTGFATFVGGNLVTWRSKKQKVVALSSAEAEYRAMKEVTKELMWIRDVLRDLGIHGVEPIPLHCDNQAAIHIASNPVFHERTKHIEVDCHFVREKIQEGILSPIFVKSEEQVADIFTKATTSAVCDHIHAKIGLLDLHQPILRGSVEQCGNYVAGMNCEMDHGGYARMGNGCGLNENGRGLAEISKNIGHDKALSPNTRRKYVENTENN